MMTSFQRYLQVLKCPIVNEITDEHIHQPSFQELLLLWLEDRKIREYEIEQRIHLKLSTHKNDLHVWATHLNTYGNTLGCPYQWIAQTTNSIPESNKQFLFWLISRAVAFDYQDKLDEQETKNLANQQREHQMEVVHEPNDENYQSIVIKCEELGRLVGMNRRKEESIVEYVRRIVQKVKFSIIAQQNQKKSDVKLSVNDFPLAQETDDPVVNQIALVLRMLYLSDFRELQNEVNDLIILGQEFTANPRLNTALGKVGR